MPDPSLAQRENEVHLLLENRVLPVVRLHLARLARQIAYEGEPYMQAWRGGEDTLMARIREELERG